VVTEGAEVSLHQALADAYGEAAELREHVAALQRELARRPAAAPPDCPYWSDGQHCYVDKRGVMGFTLTPDHRKACACGAEVKPR
jgi:hypothetical protein